MTMFKYFYHQLSGRIFIDKYLVLGLARYVGAYIIITSMIFGYFLIFMPFSFDMILLSFILAIPAIIGVLLNMDVGKLLMVENNFGFH